MESLQDRCGRLVEDFRRRPDSSARTVLVTIFGDSIEPHGAAVWTGSLVRLVEPLGINERLVRTSLNRLVRDGLLETSRAGRRSFYSATPAARREFLQAESRIYQRRRDGWDGQWTIVVEANGVAPPARAALRERLGWLGFGSLAAPVHVCPVDRTGELRQVLPDLGLDGQVAVFRGRAPGTVGVPDRALVATVTSGLAALEPAWGEFLRRFAPVADAAGGGADAGDVDPETAFLARTLVVHAYRRIVLREPELPAGLWPAGWAGDAAYEVAVRCYHALSGPAEAHLAATAETRAGRLPPLDARHAGRYPTANVRRQPAP